MELILTLQSETEVSVACDSQPSHTFDLRPLLLKDEQDLQKNPVVYGEKLYNALFPQNTLAQRVLAISSERILLVTTSENLDAIPWEYAYGPDGFLVLECPFVRGLPVQQRIKPPLLDDNLHIIAVPSNPLSHDVEPLNIDAEWMRLKEIIQEVPSTITLERTRPSTLARTRELVANQKGRIVHFMGHGGQDERGALLCFEKDNGDLDLVTAKQFMQRVRGSVFLVTLNACVSAKPGSTPFSNLAATLVRQKMPYALGMRLSIYDDDARAFSRTFYSELARGTPIEEALFQARLTLADNADSSRRWVIGVPVLYTALTEPATGFSCKAGKPTVKENQSPIPIEVTALPRAEGTFQGRIDELKQLGTYLTGDNRPPLVIIHGGGGQGKTALAREAIERFAYAWPGGVWATTLENLPSRATFVIDLARFLGIATQEILDPREVERLVLVRLVQRRMLIVLDNAETLVEAVEADNQEAVLLAQFIREQLPRPSVGLLATSRSHLGWPEEVEIELEGLKPPEGLKLFEQHAPQRVQEIDRVSAWKLSEKVEGHPLSLRLLSSAFNASLQSLQEFIEEYETQLLGAENKYAGLDHRHRTLYASIETSIRYLNDDQRILLSGLWIFHAPFLAETAVAIFDPETKETAQAPSSVHSHLHILWQRGLLIRRTITSRDGVLRFYYLLPTTRPYIEHQMEQAYEREILIARFGAAYFQIVKAVQGSRNSSVIAVNIAQQEREDIERAVESVTGIEQGYYLLDWSQVLLQLGRPHRGLELLERVLDIAQGEDQSLEIYALNTIAALYQETGHLREALTLFEQAVSICQKVGDHEAEIAMLNNIAAMHIRLGRTPEALKLYEQALPLLHELGNREREAAALNNLAMAYYEQGQLQEALKFYQQALPTRHEVGDRIGEANTLGNMAGVYLDMKQPQQALALHKEALLIRQEMGDRAGEASTLSQIATVHQRMGQMREALQLYEQALLIRQEVGDRLGEAATLDNMAVTYHQLGQLPAAQRFYGQALLISREIGDRGGEAAALNNMAEAYRDAGEWQKARGLYEQALPIIRAMGNRAREAIILDNMAGTYYAAEQWSAARELYLQALPIRREVEDRQGEAKTLSNIATSYARLGQLQEALRLFEQALPISREVGDSVTEVIILHGMAHAFEKTDRYAEALEAYQQAIILARQTSQPATEAAELVSLAFLLYSRFYLIEEAIEYIKQAIAVFENTGLSQNAAGQTVDDLHDILNLLHNRREQSANNTASNQGNEAEQEE